ncbi:MAG TPA: DUF1688 family protein [Vicinamibacteria bacterium]
MTHSEALLELRRPETIRERAETILRAGVGGGLEHFQVRLDRLPEVAQEVAAVTLATYPDRRIPVHGRFRHFQAGGIDRLRLLEERLEGLSEEEKLLSRVELAITSVLLDAGAGATWRYREAETGLVFSRSEGLAVASFHMFLDGRFSREPDHPFRATSAGLSALESADLARAFQVSRENALVGLEGRAQLMRSLARVSPLRLGYFCDLRREEIPARELLAAVLERMGLEDVFRHPKAGLVPFHKLSQWLTYSLIEPLSLSGIRVSGIEALTGLAEYRNGGLFLDLGVLQPKRAAVTAETHSPGSEVVVEWRALTVALLDRLAPLVRAELGMDEDSLPLSKVLEGGTWRAGRVVAERLRPGGAPPLKVLSDGTVF